MKRERRRHRKGGDSLHPIIATVDELVLDEDAPPIHAFVVARKKTERAPIPEKTIEFTQELDPKPIPIPVGPIVIVPFGTTNGPERNPSVGWTQKLDEAFPY
jgi:hypothetical protein